jgi:inner membrane protein
LTYKTHLLGGVAGAILITKYTEIVNVQDVKSIAFFLAGSIIGSLLPDIDHPNSYIGKKTFGMFSFFKHRGFTHSLLFSLLLFILLYFLPINVFFNIGLLIGILSHISLDMMTSSGLSYVFFPLKLKISLLPIRTSGVFEVVFFFGLLISTVLVVFT